MSRFDTFLKHWNLASEVHKYIHTYFTNLIHLTISKDDINLGYSYYKHDALNKLLSTLIMDLVSHIKSWPMFMLLSV